MLDFFTIASVYNQKKEETEIFPAFTVGRSKTLMIRGGEFYAIYDEAKSIWSTDPNDVVRLVDEALYDEYMRLQNSPMAGKIYVRYMKDYSSGSWPKYCSFIKQSFDVFNVLDNELKFADEKTTKTDYISKKLPYNRSTGECPCWNELVSTLYNPVERAKIEWAIGSIFTGASKHIQKFFVLYGDPGSGKGTILDVVCKLFDGYVEVFDAKELASRGNQFAAAAFANNPLVAIQYDADFSNIEDNTKLNSIVSHETIRVRDLFQRAFPMRINSMLLAATNSPVQITDAKSGIIRRLVDINPSGRKIEPKRYHQLVEGINFELGEIANHCINVFEEMGIYAYSGYRAIEMQDRTDVFFNFIAENYLMFKHEDGVTLKQAWTMFKEYAEDSKLRYVMPKFQFKAAMRDYFTDFLEDTSVNGIRVINYYRGFKAYKIMRTDETEKGVILDTKPDNWVNLDCTESLLDRELSDCKAQQATSDGIPRMKWVDVNTKLKDINTSKLHYVRIPENHIVIDFDLKDENGEKSANKNIEAAGKFPKTYAEYSKGGAGIHLHYIYDGDVSKLSHLYSEDIEIKVFTGLSSLRRKLSKCNDIPIATISGGLPLQKEVNKVINHEAVKNEKRLRDLITRAMEKEFGATKPSIDFINKILTDAYKAGTKYDISDLRPAIMAFAANSTNQSEYCLKVCASMPYKSDEPSDNKKVELQSKSNDILDDRLVFFDVEVFPNLLLVNWKYQGSGTWGWNEDKTKWVYSGDDSQDCVRMINPSPTEIGELFKYKLVGFNNRRYDNHILYARYLGYSNAQIYELSQRITNTKKITNNAMFGEAYNISYTDVYDFASAVNKKSLKKFEIELGLHHQELGLPWDEPVDEDRWTDVAIYCDNDVVSTEATFAYLSGDFKAREILAAITNKTVNDTTNSLTTAFIFGSEKNPKLVYTDLATGKQFDWSGKEMKATGALNAFPGYSFENGKNMYHGKDLGKGGYVYANPGMYGDALTLDVASLHPNSIIQLNLFGEYTQRFADMVQMRIYIKHGEFDKAGEMFGGLLKPYLTNKHDAKALSNALKTAINSVYGLTSASFKNPFKDERNKNNIVALRGALFIATLQEEVEAKGYKVIHIKTDSIKIANPTPEIENFCYEFAEKYGYEFEVEAKWDRICLVNNAVFIGHQTSDSPQAPNQWSATGAQFQQPYIFKTLFSKEKLIFQDYCVTKEVKSPAAMYLDMNEALGEDQHNYVFIGRNGSFAPVKSGSNGGLLMRMKPEDGKYNAVTGTKGYRWMEAENILANGLSNEIDIEYFNNLLNEAIEDISKFGDYEWFIHPEDSSIESPPWCVPCGDDRITSCAECPHFQKKYQLCDLGYDISDILIKEH